LILWADDYGEGKTNNALSEVIIIPFAGLRRCPQPIDLDAIIDDCSIANSKTLHHPYGLPAVQLHSGNWGMHSLPPSTVIYDHTEALTSGDGSIAHQCLSALDWAAATFATCPVAKSAHEDHSPVRCSEDESRWSGCCLLGLPHKEAVS
jgi:hypothetical protein